MIPSEKQSNMILVDEDLQGNKGMYEYTHSWFLGSEIKTELMNFIDSSRSLRILEIGCYEGISSCFFSDEVLLHEDSTLTCVDPFDLGDTTTPLTELTEQRFLANIHKSRNCNKVRICKMTSDTYFAMYHDEVDASLAQTKFDLIYIDGSHVPNQIARDCENAYCFTAHNGIIWMDDYKGNGNAEITRVMDVFIASKGNHLRIIYNGERQIAVRKID